MAVADDEVHAIERRDFMWRALRITAGYDDSGLGILAANAANKGAGAAVGFSRNAASIENDQICRIQCCGFAQAAVAQSGGDCFSVGTAGPAPEVLNVICFHIIEFINATPSPLTCARNMAKRSL